MEVEIKVGDKVQLRDSQRGTQGNTVYRVVNVDVDRSGQQQENTSQNTSNDLYGRETERLSLPQASYRIAPEHGGNEITVVQGEIDLVTSETTHSTQ